MYTEIHPKFKSELFAVRFLKYFFPFLSSVLIVIALYFFIGELKHNEIKSEVMFIFPGVVILSIMLGASGFFLKKREDWIYNLSEILIKTQPQEKIINSTEIMSFKGAVYLLTDEGDTDLKNGEFVTVQVAKNKKPVKPPAKVNYYFNDKLSDSIILIDDFKNVFTGSKMDKNFAKEQLNKSIKFAPFLPIIGLLIPMIVIVIFLIKKSNFDNYEKYVLSSQNWQSVEGEIISSSSVEVEIKRGKQRIPGFKVEIMYQYTVNNKSYVADLIRFDYEPTPNFDDAKELLRNFPVGQIVPVYYDPNNNSKAFLIHADINYIRAENNKITIVLYIVFGVSVLITGILMFFSNRMLKRQKELLSKL